MNTLRQIEGRNPVVEALKIPGRVKKILLSETIRKDERVLEILRQAYRQKIDLSKISAKKLLRRSQTNISQGVIAFAEYPDSVNLNKLIEKSFEHQRPPFFVVIYGVSYEQNLGAIIRTAEAAGVDAVVVPKDVNVYTPVVARASMGAIEYLPVIQTGIYAAIKRFKDEGIKLIAADLQAKQALWQADLSGGVALILGAETGLSSNLIDKCDQLVKIPMLGQIDSLNMSVAAGITIFEVLRQRQTVK